MNGPCVNVLVLGGFGFLGKHVCTALQQRGHTVVSHSRRTGLDLLQPHALPPLLKELQPQVIVNAAAHVGSVHYVSEKAADVLHDNALMAMHLYRSVSQCRPSAVIVNPLSNCSYPGDADVQFENRWFAGPVHPSVMSYGNAKRFIHTLSQCYHRQHQLRTMNFLVPNAFGPGDHTDPNRTHALNGMILRMIAAHRRNDPTFEIWGTGKPIREWGYILDIAAIMADSITRLDELREQLLDPVNIAQLHGQSIAESAQLIAQELGYPGQLVFNPKFQDGAPVKILDNARFRGLFPQATFTDPRLAIRATVAYYLDVLQQEK